MDPVWLNEKNVILFYFDFGLFNSINSKKSWQSFLFCGADDEDDHLYDVIFDSDFHPLLLSFGFFFIFLYFYSLQRFFIENFIWFFLFFLFIETFQCSMKSLIIFITNLFIPLIHPFIHRSSSSKTFPLILVHWII